MVLSYIKGNCIILVTVPMTGISNLTPYFATNVPDLDDLENQKALRLAQIADPNKERTIGERAYSCLSERFRLMNISGAH
jgi:hypothetical protein